MEIVRMEEFNPVTIKIESTEELAKLYALSRHNQICRTLELDDLFYKLKSVVSERETELSNKWYDKLFGRFGVGI